MLIHLPDFLWELGLKLETLDLKQNQFEEYPLQLESFADSLQNLEIDSSAPEFVQVLKVRAKANRKIVLKSIE